MAVSWRMGWKGGKIDFRETVYEAMAVTQATDDNRLDWMVAEEMDRYIN